MSESRIVLLSLLSYRFCYRDKTHGLDQFLFSFSSHSHLPKLPDLLESEDVNLRIVAGEAIAMFYELAREEDEVSVCPIYLKYNVVGLKACSAPCFTPPSVE